MTSQNTGVAVEQVRASNIHIDRDRSTIRHQLFYYRRLAAQMSFALGRDFNYQCRRRYFFQRFSNI